MRANPKVYKSADRTIVTIYNTQIVEIGHGYVILNSGGFRTHTTKRHMNNAFSANGVSMKVFQKDAKWYVKDQEGQVHNYYDGMAVAR